MKKAPLFAAAIILFGCTALEASAQTKTTEKQTTSQQTIEQQAIEAPPSDSTAVAEEKREKITKAQLPAPVQQVLLQDALAAWQLSEIYRVAPAVEGDRNQYVIFFTNGEKKKARIRVDEAGEIITSKK